MARFLNNLLKLIKMKTSSEEKKIEQTNEAEYQKSEASKKAENTSATPKPAKSASNLAVREEGFTDGQGNYIVSQNGVLTDAQKEQIKDGKWKKYKKLSDGSYQF